jgi:ribosomal protein L34
MLKGGLMQDIAFRDIVFTQNFEADVTIRPANEYGYDIGFITLDNLRGEVAALLLNPVSKDFVTKEYQGIDVAGLKLALATGYKAVLRVEMNGGGVWEHEVLGVKGEEDGKGKVKVAVKAIGDGANISQKKMFKKAKMEIYLIQPFTDVPTFWSWSSEVIEARYDSKKNTLNIANDLPPGQQMFFSWAAGQDTLIIFEFKRSSSSGEGEMIKVVANVEWVKADREGLKVKLSNKEIKGEGKPAKKATKALDGLKSGRYSMRVGPLADASESGLLTYSLSSDIQSARRYFGGSSFVVMDVEEGAMLKKRKREGEYRLQFKTKEGSSILYKDGENRVRSKSVKSYLKALAGKFNQPLSNEPNENVWVPDMLRMKTASGKEVLGELTGLRWDANRKMWTILVGVGLGDAERLEADDEIFKPLVLELLLAILLFR